MPEPTSQPGRTIRKAIIPVAGRGTRLFPATAAVPKALFPLVDADGVARAMLHIILRQARTGGIEQFAVVVSPGQDELLRRYFRRHEDVLAGGLGPRAAADAAELADLGERIVYVTQPTPDGFGHAVWCGRQVTGDEPFLVMLGDSICRPLLADAGQPPNPVAEVLRAYAAIGGVSVTGVAMTLPEDIALRGTVAVREAPVPGDLSGLLFGVREIVEKPDRETARQRLRIPRLEREVYFTHAGLYAFSPVIFSVLEELIRQRGSDEVQLTSAQQRLVQTHEDYYAMVVQGSLLDMGTPAGLVDTQMSLSLAGKGVPRRS